MLVGMVITQKKEEVDLDLNLGRLITDWLTLIVKSKNPGQTVQFNLVWVLTNKIFTVNSKTSDQTRPDKWASSAGSSVES